MLDSSGKNAQLCRTGVPYVLLPRVSVHERVMPRLCDVPGSHLVDTDCSKTVALSEPQLYLHVFCAGCAQPRLPTACSLCGAGVPETPKLCTELGAVPCSMHRDERNLLP